MKSKRAMGLEALEGRVLMSAASGRTSGTAEAVQPHAATHMITADASAPAVAPAASTVTMADRWDLLAHWRGPIARSLKYRLLANDAAGFDRMLLDYMVQRTGSHYFFEPADVPLYAQFIYAQAGPRGADLGYAGATLAHRFLDPSQVGLVQLPAGEIDWDAQPASVTNPEFLHTLNRQAFWRDLAWAYRATGHADYANELIAQLTSWSRQNPPLADPATWPSSGTHWWLFDAAARADNWTRAYMLMLGTPAWTPEANTLFLRGIYLHGDLLFRAPPDKVTSNKAATEAVSLLKLAVAFPEFAAAADWQAQANDRMFRCLDAQFYPDGAHVEESPGYQANAMLTFLEAFALQNRTGRGAAWSRRHRLKLQNTMTALGELRSPDGTLAALSDTARGDWPDRALLRASLVLGLPPTVSRGILDEDIWLAGPDRVQAFEAEPRQPNNWGNPAGYALPDAGYYTLRGGPQVIFDAGPKGGSHGHYDLLSFELQQGNHLIVADPGRYRYDDSAERRWVQSTPAHNTISIDGLNHAAVEGAHNPAIVVDDFQLADDHAQVTAHHHAYEYLKGRPVVGRTIWVDRDHPYRSVTLVIDWAHAAATHTFTTSFTLPGTSASKVYDGGIDYPYDMAGESWMTKARFQSLPVAGQAFSRESRFISGAFTDQAPATRFAVSQRGRDAVFATLISDRDRSSGFNVTAAWDTPPVPGKTLHIRLTYSDGTTRVLSFTPPSLATLGTAPPAAAAAAAAPRPADPAIPVLTPTVTVRTTPAPSVFATGAGLSDEDWLPAAPAPR